MQVYDSHASLSMSLSSKYNFFPLPSPSPLGPKILMAGLSTLLGHFDLGV